MLKVNRIAGIFLVLVLLFLITLPVLADHTPKESGSSSKLLALTFDDGPGPDTGRLLDALKERDAKATFFMVGERLESNAAYREYLRRMVEEGHQVANHSYSHTALTKLTPEAVAREISGTEKYLEKAGGDQTYFIRPPEGAYNEAVQKAAGAPLILWNVDPMDWNDRDTETVYKRIVSDADDGDIILLHDIYPTSVDGAIKAIDTLQKKGYEFVTVSELLDRRGITPQNGEVYACAPNTGVDPEPAAVAAQPTATPVPVVTVAAVLGSETPPQETAADTLSVLPQKFIFPAGELLRWSILGVFIVLVTLAIVLVHAKTAQGLTVRVPSRYKRATLSRCHAILLHEITQENSNHV